MKGKVFIQICSMDEMSKCDGIDDDVKSICYVLSIQHTDFHCVKKDFHFRYHCHCVTHRFRV